MNGDGFSFDFPAFFRRLGSIGVIDIIDILLVAALLYAVYAFIRDRRAGRLAVGIILLGVIMIISNLIGFRTVSYIMTNFFQIGFIALVVVFQPELRSALEKVGGEPLRGLRSISDRDVTKNATERMIAELSSACGDMSADKTGALIVIERTSNLDNVVKGGVELNSDLTSPMLRSVFYKGTPLHDGAAIIRDNRLYRAAVILPLSTDEKRQARRHGTRHHAALGISEESDAVAVVVSEETGGISIAYSGNLIPMKDRNELRSKLIELLETGVQHRKKQKNGKASRSEAKEEQA
ncbi:MAG: diadenylate cyclase CdaA [Clostridia bacterium]|nr:diadenylate cyclase CdaA [Clostridia bacterium]